MMDTSRGIEEDRDGREKITETRERWRGVGISNRRSREKKYDHDEMKGLGERITILLGRVNKRHWPHGRKGEKNHHNRPTDIVDAVVKKTTPMKHCHDALNKSMMERIVGIN